MTAYEFSFYSISQIISGLLALGVGLFLFQFKKSPGAKYLAVMELGIAVWAITQGLEVAATSLSQTTLWSKFSYLGITTAPFCYFLFAQQYSQRRKVLCRAWIYSLLIIPIITLLFVFSNEYHHLFWETISLQEGSTLTYYTYGPVFWAYYAYTYVLMFTGFVSILWAVFKFPKHYKPQVISLLLGTSLPMISNWLYVFNINPIQGYDWTPLAFCFSGIFIAFGVIRLRIFKLIPFARNIMVDNMEEGVLVIDSTQTIVDNNEAIKKLFGDDNYIGIKLIEKFPELPALLDKKLKSKTHIKEVELKSKDQTLYFDLTISEFSKKRKFFSGHLIILHNVSKRVRAEQSLIKTNQKLKEQIKLKEKLINDLDAFSHMVAHDLKNLLGVIVTSSEAINYSLKNNYMDDVTDYNKIIGNSATKTITITRELLLLASIRKEDVKQTSINMGAIVHEVITRMEPFIEKTGAKISQPQSWPHAIGYYSWIEEVWFNYIHNAIKYGGNPPIVKLGYELTEDKNVKFTVSDNGDGLPEEDLKKLFTQFTRLDNLKVKGHGLGLSIVKRIMEKLDGEVSVESQNKKGEGCVFSFILPLWDSKENEVLVDSKEKNLK